MPEDFQLKPVDPEAWTREDTVEYLTDYPLPNDFLWNGHAVVPSHTQVTGYGKWLKETPYHRGLFPLIHRLLEEAPHLPKPRTATAQTDALVALIRTELARPAKQGTLF